jgi:glycine betaine/choline ABC-type transport system substrate-binding protein
MVAPPARTILTPPGVAVTAQIGQALRGTLVVGARREVENVVLAELYAQVLSAAGFEVARQFSFERAVDANNALVEGDIDLYPERASIAAGQVFGLDPLSAGGASPGAVAAAYEALELAWLAPAAFGARDPTAPVVRAETLAFFPELAPILDAASARLTDEVMAGLVSAVRDRRREPAVVAGELLAATATGTP